MSLTNFLGRDFGYKTIYRVENDPVTIIEFNQATTCNSPFCENKRPTKYCFYMTETQYFVCMGCHVVLPKIEQEGSVSSGQR